MFNYSNQYPYAEAPEYDGEQDIPQSHASLVYRGNNSSHCGHYIQTPAPNEDGAEQLYDSTPRFNPNTWDATSSMAANHDRTFSTASGESISGLTNDSSSNLTYFSTTGSSNNLEQNRQTRMRFESEVGGLPYNSLSLENTSVGTGSSTVKIMKGARSTRSSAKSKGLNPEYRQIRKEDWSTFCKFGRVFWAPWTQPADKKHESKVTSNSEFSMVRFQMVAHTKVQLFVVVGFGWGHVKCSPIFTYGNQGILKPNLADADQHAIIYTSDREPPPHQMMIGTELRKEEFGPLPIKVQRELDAPEGDLGDYSRLNYSKIYIVEDYVPVLNVGVVVDEHLESLSEACILKPSYQNPISPSSRTSPSYQESSSHNNWRPQGHRDQRKRRGKVSSRGKSHNGSESRC